jgi:UDP:flavonoid glycosyltransferase YjiC (YdhE family)
LVAVGLTTTYQAHRGLLDRTVEALASLPVKAFVSTGGMDLGRLPSNVYSASYVPHARLLPLADVVVTHAGLGTVHAALAQGRPLVCLPIGRDQPDNAARVVSRGAGIRLRPNASPSKIAAAVTTVLEDARLTKAARRLSADMERDRAATAGPDELIRLAEMGRTTAGDTGTPVSQERVGRYVVE